MRATPLVLALSLVFAAHSPAQLLEPRPALPGLEKFAPVKAPKPEGLLLKKGDRLAIIGDSITEQRMYSRFIETYLTACTPQLEITARQYGWSGETAEGFVRRMTNDTLRFQPTVATTCYGMNDHKYRPYDEANAQWYRDNQTTIVRALKAAGARVVLGSPGCVGKMPSWVKSADGTIDDLNGSLCKFRNIDIEIARAEGVNFADVFWPMMTSFVDARQRHGNDYYVSGKDGVHPGWAGQTVMAYAFLKGMGLDGAIGTFTVDLGGNKATASDGHAVLGFAYGELKLRSDRYPFCAQGSLTDDGSIRSGMTLIPFNQELNRLTLVAKGGTAAKYKITWGSETKAYTAEELAKGVNLAADFAVNPFTAAFEKVDAAVAAKQEYETRQIKTLFHGPEGRADKEMTAALTEKARAPLAAAVAKSRVPVEHTIRIAAE
jgi:lysophospholipase L1-like esterase